MLKDSQTDIEVRETGDGETGNILWVYIQNTRFAFRYEHHETSIEIRENSYNGAIRLKVTNNTATSDIITELTRNI